MAKVKTARKKIKSKSYKLWIVIEEQTEYTDGSFKERDIEDCTASVGHFKKRKDAIEQMENLSDLHLKDGDTN